MLKKFLQIFSFGKDDRDSLKSTISKDDYLDRAVVKKRVEAPNITQSIEGGGHEEMFEPGESDKNSGNILAGAILRTINEFGESILTDKRFANIIKDYKGFKAHPFAEIIIKTLVSSKKMGIFFSLKGRNTNEISNLLQSEISKINKLYGFSYEGLSLVFTSIASGMGLEFESFICDVKDLGSTSTNKTEENQVGVYDDSEDEDEDEYIDYVSYEEIKKDKLKAAIKLSRIICDLLYVDPDEFDLDTEILELEDQGLDIYDLMFEISNELDVDLDWDEIIDCDRLHDLVDLIVEKQD